MRGGTRLHARQRRLVYARLESFELRSRLSVERVPLLQDTKRKMVRKMVLDSRNGQARCANVFPVENNFP